MTNTEAKVEQRHRDFAADNLHFSHLIDAVRAGERDNHPLVLAFARFEAELASPPSGEKEQGHEYRRGIEDAARTVRYHPDAQIVRGDGSLISKDLANAVRALTPTPKPEPDVVNNGTD